MENTNIRGYRLTRHIAKAESFNAFLCQTPDGSWGIAKVATAAAHNPTLDREAFILQILRDEAARLEREYEPRRSHPGERLNYQIAFPALRESFVAEELDGLAVTILDLSAFADEAWDVVSLDAVVRKDEMRVDPKTSAWILGKMLKLLAFAHSVGIAVRDVSPGNFLINRREHFVLLFDWSEAELIPEIPPHLVSQDIAEATRSAIEALGGDPDAGTIPADDQLPDGRYASLLASFLAFEFEDALKAHGEFYRLVEEMWPHRFHKFRAYSLLTGEVEVE